MKVLIANRGEIACRIVHTLREMQVASVAVYTPADAGAPHVTLADEAVALPHDDAYLDAAALLAGGQQVQATAVHPGYGFLSQSPTFAAACAAAGLGFIGPSPAAITALGDKRAARDVAERHGVPVVPGATACDDIAAAEQAVRRLGLPVLIKAAGGGGGKGMRLVQAGDSLAQAFAAAQREATAAFADPRLLLEKYIHPARHIEVQIVGDGQRAVALAERECSLQRRYQKIIEEGPAACLRASTRAALHTAAIAIAEAVHYSNAGTVEFLLDAEERFYFLEVNTRLQVEHPVTESILGLDIVRLQVELAHGGSLPAVPTPRGHAIEARLNAEDAYAGFLPATGRVLQLEWPQLPGVRVDAGIVPEQRIGVHYDNLLAKIIAWAPSREQARRRLVQALQQLTLLGVQTNQRFLIDLLERDFFRDGQTFTTTVEQTPWQKPEPPPWLQQALPAARAALAAQPATAPPEAAAASSPYQALGAYRGAV